MTAVAGPPVKKIKQSRPAARPCPPPAADAAAQVLAYRPYRLTVEQMMALVDAGLLSGRIELVDGELTEMAAQGNRHRNGITYSMVHLQRGWKLPRFISVQGTHRFTEHDGPEPDLCLLTAAPVPGALIDELPSLVVEVSDTTLAVDLGRKKRDYARFLVPEYWVLDVNGRRLFVHRDPVADAADAVSAWRDERIVPQDGTVSPLCVPGLTITVADLLGPA